MLSGRKMVSISAGREAFLLLWWIKIGSHIDKRIGRRKTNNIHKLSEGSVVPDSDPFWHGFDQVQNCRPARRRVWTGAALAAARTSSTSCWKVSWVSCAPSAPRKFIEVPRATSSDRLHCTAPRTLASCCWHLKVQHGAQTWRLPIVKSLAADLFYFVVALLLQFVVHIW